MFCNVWSVNSPVCARCVYGRALESSAEAFNVAHSSAHRLCRCVGLVYCVCVLMERLKNIITPMRTRPTDTEPDRAGPTQLGSAANVVDADLQDPQVQVPADQNLDHEAIAADVVQADHRNRPARHSPLRAARHS